MGNFCMTSSCIDRDVMHSKGQQGILRFYGPHKTIAGQIVAGIELDDPAGHCDGTVNGHTYFFSAPNHGVLVDATLVTVLVKPDHLTSAF